MKYEVGDKVVIVSERTNNMNYKGEMDKYLGEVMTVKVVRNGGYKMVEGCNDIVMPGGWSWCESDIDHEKTRLLNRKLNVGDRVKLDVSGYTNLLDVGTIVGQINRGSSYIVEVSHPNVGKQKLLFDNSDILELIENSKGDDNMYKVGDKVILKDYVSGLDVNEVYTIIETDYPGNDGLPIRLENELYKPIWVSDEKVTRVDDSPTRLYQLFEHYSHKENRGDKFTDSTGDVIYYDDVHIMICGYGEVTEYYSSHGILTETVKKIVVKEMTVEQIEEKLGYKIKVVE